MLFEVSLIGQLVRLHHANEIFVFCECNQNLNVESRLRFVSLFLDFLQGFHEFLF